MFPKCTRKGEAHHRCGSTNANIPQLPGPTEAPKHGEQRVARAGLR
jgi:hypothetical protein